jgi:formylglycine-generating enzyme required for sulfatase activity
VLVLAGSAFAVDMEWVTVGDPGNAPDLRFGEPGHGQVDYVFQIAKYEVTNAQYAAFLNAVAADDPNSLYNEEMAEGWHDIGGIVRNGSPGSYAYTVRPNRGRRPAAYVSWFDALRFANWMHNSEATGPQDAATTEDGAYDMSFCRRRTNGTRPRTMRATANTGAIRPSPTNGLRPSFHPVRT